MRRNGHCGGAVQGAECLAAAHSAAQAEAEEVVAVVASSQGGAFPGLYAASLLSQPVVAGEPLLFACCQPTLLETDAGLATCGTDHFANRVPSCCPPAALIGRLRNDGNNSVLPAQYQRMAALHTLRRADV